MRIIFKLFLIFSVIGCGIVSFGFKKEIQESKTIHVYMDPASTPALLQMVDFIRQPEEDFKIVIWDRYHSYIKYKEKYKNTVFLDLQEVDKQRNDLALKKYPENPSPLLIYLDEILEKEPNAKIVIHFNGYHDGLYWTLLNTSHISEKVRDVHVYEDASAHIFRERSKDYIFQDNIKKYFYYWGDVDKLCTGSDALKGCPFVQEILKKTHPVNIDFEKIANQLSLEEKEKIFDLAGFDYQKTKKLFTENKTGIYILGVDVINPDAGAQLAALKFVCDRTKAESSGGGWLYKHHPNGRWKATPEVLNYLCPGIKPLDSHIPYELLLISGLRPNKVAGFSSSLFFNEKRENIVAYLPRENNVYLAMLKKAGRVDNDNLFDKTKQADLLEKSGIFEFVLNGKTKLSVWGYQVGEKKICNPFSSLCYEASVGVDGVLEMMVLGRKRYFKKQKAYRWIEVENGGDMP